MTCDCKTSVEKCRCCSTLQKEPNWLCVDCANLCGICQHVICAKHLIAKQTENQILSISQQEYICVECLKNNPAYFSDDEE